MTLFRIRSPWIYEMPPAAPISEFRRSEVPSWERLSAGFVFALLATLSAWIFWKGKTYDTARYLPTVADSGQNNPSKSLLEGLAGFPPLSETEVYSPETLFEKINGRAPAYFDFGFKELQCRTFAVENLSGEFVDVFVYTMGSPLDAFGIYSMENSGESNPLDFVADGVRGGFGSYFRRGDAYVQVNGSSELPQVQQVVDRLARELALRLPADERGLEAKEGLVLEGIRAGTMTYIRENAYGQETLRGVFEAEVERKGALLRVFVMRADSPEAAGTAWVALRDFYQRFGRVVKTEGAAADGSAWFVGESFGQTAGVYLKGQLVGGSMDAGGMEAAENLLRELTATVGETP
jgi:hypothetical protein